MQPPHILLIVALDIAPEKEEEFNHWYNTKHIPDVLRAPGFVSAFRSRAFRGKPKYWAFYEAESEEALAGALASPEFKIASDDFTQNWQQHVSNFAMTRVVHCGP